MTISRVKPGNWGVNEKLTSSQMNSVDTNATYALDKRSAQTDTLESVVAMTGAGRFDPSVVVGANADTTYQLGSNAANVIRVTSAVTASRIYTLSATGATTNAVISVYCEPSFVTYTITVKDQAAATLFELGNIDSADGQWASFIYIGGWRLLHGGQGSKIRTQEFTSSGSWTCPRGVTKVTLVGYGGGGGGGGGYGNPAADVYTSGGGGGGGAVKSTQTVTVVPGTVYTVTIGGGGSGGAGGASGSPGVHGGNGSATTFGSLATFAGGGGGNRGVAASSGASVIGYGTGGIPIGPQPTSGWFVTESADTHFGFVWGMPGHGGHGFSMNGASTGRGYGESAGEYTGGSPGTPNTTSSGSYRGGGAGGGGGACAGQPGGAVGFGAGGGSGGSPNSGGAGGAPTNGASASANSGAGGGGGGSAGGATASTIGAGGGAGGSGWLQVTWVK